MAIKAQLTRRALSKILSLDIVSIKVAISTSQKITQSSRDVLHGSCHRWHCAPKQKAYATIPYQSTNYLRSQSSGCLRYREEGRFLRHLFVREAVCRLRVGLSVLGFWLRLSRKSVSRPTYIFESAGDVTAEDTELTRQSKYFCSRDI